MKRENYLLENFTNEFENDIVFARHDPDLLAQAVLDIYRSRAVRIFRGERRYILEE